MRTITAEDVKSRALTADEKGWLAQRDRHAEVEENEALFGREVVAGSGEIEAGTGPQTPATPAKDDDDGDDYDSWKIRELKEEGEARTPPVDFTGCAKKEDFVLALRAWDLEHPEDDDTKE